MGEFSSISKTRVQQYQTIWIKIDAQLIMLGYKIIGVNKGTKG